jgi:hypothetical protein
MSGKWTKRQAIQVLLYLILFGSVSLGAVPGIINYQGRLTNASGEAVADGDYLIKFKIYGSLIGTDSLWSSGFQTVTVTGGLFTYQLGTGISLPNGLFKTDTLRYLGITVGTEAEISPRSRLVSSAYAFKAIVADTALVANVANDVAAGIITNSDISASAAIAAIKISGTAATLTNNQAFGGDNAFGGNVYFGDSTMTVNNEGITMGSSIAPLGYDFVNIRHSYNTTEWRDGIDLSVANLNSSGRLYGIASTSAYRTAGSAGVAYGLFGSGISDAGSRYGVMGTAFTYSAVTTAGSYGVYGAASYGAAAYGIYGTASSATSNYAGYFSGNVVVTGSLNKGGGAFKIDHPLDPENKYLQHSFVESPDMMNIYNGNAILNEKGEAEIELPEWFGALNRDFRYQLTAVGAPGPNLYIAQKVIENKFMVAGGTAGMEVSWQVTGIRKDKWAEANRIQVEVDKKADEKGKYIHPEVYNLPLERSIDYENLKPAIEEREKAAAENNEN